MATDLVEMFGESLAGLDVGLTRTESGAFAGALEGIIEEPVVGAPLPFEDVSLAGTSVTVNPTPAELRAANTGVTAAGLGIAEYGTLAIQSRPGGDEPVSLYPERHVAILRESDLVVGVPEALSETGAAFDSGLDSTVLATGASATADMGELVEGVHGPGEVHVVLVTDR